MKITCQNRVKVAFENSTLLLDPKYFPPDVDCAFISHAHTDHLPTTRKKPPKLPPIVCSEATARLFKKRVGYRIKCQKEWENEDFKISFVPCGHTFDSTAAVIFDKKAKKKIIYTGDINIQDRGYLEGFKPMKCDILIVEATWGDRHYQFPLFADQMEKARSYIREELQAGKPVAVLGYALGKAQLLNYCLGDLCEKRYSVKSIWDMEQIHRELGLELKSTEKLTEYAISNFKEGEPWLLFFTHVRANNVMLNRLKRKFDMRVVGFSGWARNESSYKFRTGAHAAFIVSDHADYSSLLRIVKGCKPEIVYTVFGEAEALAKELQRDGLNAIPLREGQQPISDFF